MFKLMKGLAEDIKDTFDVLISQWCGEFDIPVFHNLIRPWWLFY